MSKSTLAGSWSVERCRGGADALLASMGSGGPRRRVAVCEVTRPALVLGSTQAVDHVDWSRVAARRLDVARRSGGGGCVVVGPGDQAWFELWLPRDDVLWVDDVVKSFDWVGRAWLDALGQLGIGDLELCPHAVMDGPWARKICFAGRGPGEVLAGGRKVVGLSQRRSRLGANFHIAALVNWDASGMLDLMAGGHGPDGGHERSARSEQEALDQLARGLGDVVSGPQLEEAFLCALPE